MFVITDFTTVWVVGDLYEKDLALVRLGAPATISIPAAPQTLLRGKVSYIDPRLEPATRTAKVRIEVPNANRALRLGMFVTVSFQSGSQRPVTLVPRAAVQAVGERTVVYVPVDDAEGRFTERLVKLGPPVGEFFPVLEGLRSGERVVTEGSFFLRAEATRTRSGG
jgi:RND family efflux transporter MFP subunit